jgi:RHS repeat-associated protein
MTTCTRAIEKEISGCVSSASDPPYFCMEWNAEGQLKRVSLNGNEVARFSYDPAGRRVEKVAGGVTTSYLYDGEDILRETRGAGTFKYVHGPGIDEPLAREDGSGTLTYYHADGLGSVLKRTNQAGAVVHEYRYDVWGKIEAGAGEPGYAFTGREWDPGIGLYYNRERYYDARVGRFVSYDPAGSDGGANLYAYADGNPARWTDPLGLASEDPFDEIAKSRLREIYRKCRRLRYPWEYRGAVCGCSDSEGSHYWAEAPQLGKSGEDAPDCLSGTLVAIYHCHPPGDVSAEYFGGDDSMTQHWIHGPVYLITPKGVMKKLYGNALQKEIGQY